MPKTTIPAIPLDDEEKELMQSFATGEWEKLDSKHSKALKETLESAGSCRTDKKQITIKLGSSDIDLVKQRAKKIGIPYQNIIGALVHNYAIGKIRLEV